MLKREEVDIYFSDDFDETLLEDICTSKFLFNCEDVTLKLFDNNSYTLLEYMCKNENNTTFGVELLLNDHRIKVNECCYSPLYLALTNIKREEDSTCKKK